MRNIFRGLCFGAVMLMPFGAMAVESKSVIKGSFRALYPDAVVVAKDVATGAMYTGQTDKSFPVSFQTEFTRAGVDAIAYAEKFCEGKSRYAIVDNFEVHTAIHSNQALLFTTDYNVICFDLPGPATHAAPAAAPVPRQAAPKAVAPKQAVAKPAAAKPAAAKPAAAKPAVKQAVKQAAPKKPKKKPVEAEE